MVVPSALTTIELVLTGYLLTYVYWYICILFTIYLSVEVKMSVVLTLLHLKDCLKFGYFDLFVAA